MLLVCVLGTAPKTLGDSVRDLQLRLALPAPRTKQLALQLKRRNQRLMELSDGRVSLRVYWGGAAGDERTVLRKMRSGQIDGTAFTLNTVSEFVREALVLEAPALCLKYKQLQALRAELVPRFNAEASRNGFKILAWGDFGRLRYFSKHPIRKPSDFRAVRPWTLPRSEMMRELYHLLGTEGIALELSEVYGGMVTGMIDTFWGTSAIASMLQWHHTARYVSAPMGFINGALVLSQNAWDRLPQDVHEDLERLVDDEAASLQLQFRAGDARAHQRLLTRGYEELAWTELDAWWALGHRLRRRLIGRVYTAELLQRVEAVALRHADPLQVRAFAVQRP